MAFSTLDIVLVLPLVFGFYRGYKKGFLMELVALLSLVLGIIGGFRLMHYGMVWLEGRLGEFQSLAPFIAFLGIFVIIIVLVNLLGRAAKSLLDMTLLGSLDKFVGALVGLLKWAFGVSIVLWLLNLAEVFIPEEMIEGSLLFPYLVQFAPWVVEMASALLPFAQDLFDQVKELFPTELPFDPTA